MPAADNSGRERILTRIRSALRTPAPRHHLAGEAGPTFVPVEDSRAQFESACAANSTELLSVSDAREAEDALLTVLASVPSGEVYGENAPLLRRLLENSREQRTIRWSNEGAPSETSQATITRAESLVASTGSILIASSAAGRGASVVAPVHIVVVSQTQLVPDLASALKRVKERGLPERNSALFLITGSSRTADIEKILVLGAHGPRRLVVILGRHLD